MQFYPFSVGTALGAQHRQTIAGQYIYFDSASLGIDYPTVRIKTSAGDDFLLKPGKGVQLARPFVWFSVQNYERQSIITGVMQIGSVDERIDENRMQGQVEVIDGGKSRSVAGTAFIHGGYCAPVVAKYPFVSLENPSGSGKRISVFSVRLKLSGNGAIFWTFEDTELTTQNGTSISKYSNGAIGVGIAAYQNEAAYFGAGATVDEASVTANVTYAVEYREPLVVEPGKILRFCSLTATNTGLGYTAETTEEAI